MLGQKIPWLKNREVHPVLNEKIPRLKSSEVHLMLGEKIPQLKTLRFPQWVRRFLD